MTSTVPESQSQFYVEMDDAQQAMFQRLTSPEALTVSVESTRDDLMETYIDMRGIGGLDPQSEVETVIGIVTGLRAQEGLDEGFTAFVTAEMDNDGAFAGVEANYRVDDPAGGFFYVTTFESERAFERGLEGCAAAVDYAQVIEGMLGDIGKRGKRVQAALAAHHEASTH